jgi:phage terminase small subunit
MTNNSYAQPHRELTPGRSNRNIRKVGKSPWCGMSMSIQRQTFAQAFVETQDVQLAAKRAGYKNANSGKQLLRENDVKTYIEQLTREINAKAKLTIDHKLNKLKDVMDVSIPEDKEELKVTDPSRIKVGLSAIDLSCKIQGHYAPERAINVNTSIEADKIKELVGKYERDF